MKPRTDIAHMGTIGKKNRTQMTLDTNSLAHLMSVLTDLYSDPELAVIREYATNALDSHIASGNKDPIQVDLPTALRRVFVIRDFGLGMSETDVVENFSRYGYSSKRETDEQVGMLGLGCKSALTYSSQFTFIATKDNQQSTVLVTRDETGAGALQIMDSRKVNRPNGVEIQIPVKDNIEAFNAKAQNFFQFWDPGTVLINGQPIKSVWDPKVQEEKGITVLDDDLILRPNAIVQGYGSGSRYNPRTGLYEQPGRHFIVMGNVPYPVTETLSEILSGGIVARVPVGAVNFTPSREQLQDTALTKDTIREIQAHVTRTTVRRAQEEVAAAKSPFEAAKIYNKWMNLSGNKINAATLTYKNAPIPKNFKNDVDLTMDWQAYRYGGSLDMETRASRFQRAIPISVVDDSLLVVTNHKAKQIAKGTKERIIKHVNKLKEKDPKLEIKRVFLTDTDPFGDWVKHKVTLEQLREYAVPAAPRKARAKVFRVVRAGGSEAPARELDDAVQKVLIPAGDGDGVRSAVGNVCHGRTDVVGVIVGSNAAAGFAKKQKNVLTVEEFAEQEVKAYNNSITALESWFSHGIPTAAEKLVLTFSTISTGDQLDDMQIKSAIQRINAVDASAISSRFAFVARLTAYHSTLEYTTALKQNDKAAKPFLDECEAIYARYPLLRFSLSAKEAVDYINQTYYYNQNKKAA